MRWPAQGHGRACNRGSTSRVGHFALRLTVTIERYCRLSCSNRKLYFVSFGQGRTITSILSVLYNVQAGNLWRVCDKAVCGAYPFGVGCVYCYCGSFLRYKTTLLPKSSPRNRHAPISDRESASEPCASSEQGTAHPPPRFALARLPCPPAANYKLVTTATVPPSVSPHRAPVRGCASPLPGYSQPHLRRFPARH